MGRNKNDGRKQIRIILKAICSSWGGARENILAFSIILVLLCPIAFLYQFQLRSGSSFTSVHG
jgi:hypothetical protein